MKRPSVFLALLALAPFSVFAQETAAPTWHARSLGEALLYMVIFTLVGIALAVLGYKIFDWLTPGDLSKEILENRNVAAAIVAAAVVIGICILVAAAMIG